MNLEQIKQKAQELSDSLKIKVYHCEIPIKDSEEYIVSFVKEPIFEVKAMIFDKMQTQGVTISFLSTIYEANVIKEASDVEMWDKSKSENHKYIFSGIIEYQKQMEILAIEVKKN